MVDALDELRARATVFHRRVQDREVAALARLRALPELRKATDPQLEQAAAEIKRQQCLNVIARELGFSHWRHAKQIFDSEAELEDFGTMLAPPKCCGFVNHWYAQHEEAARAHVLQGGYLLPYKRHFLIVTRDYVKTLGLDPDDPDWDRMGHDWARPRDSHARRRLYGKLIAQRPLERA